MARARAGKKGSKHAPCSPLLQMGEKHATLACGYLAASLCAVALSGYAMEGPPAVAVYSFEDATVGQPPSGFTEALTAGGGPVKWQVIEQKDAPSSKQVVAQLSQDTTNARYPLLILEEFTARDVDISVRFNPMSGKVDQAAGIVWRLQDKDNYFVVRANALEDNVVAYKTVAGKRSSIGIKADAGSYGVRAKVPPKQWSKLGVRMVGNLMEIYLNDHKLFEVENDAFAIAGRVGLWTKADSVTYFDELKITPLDER